MMTEKALSQETKTKVVKDIKVEKETEQSLKPNKIITSIIVLVFSLFILGVYDVFFDVEDNKCDMTYMFQTPNYIPVPGMENLSNKYKLFVYGEGSYAKPLIAGQITGIPVLFVPGNSGSYKQVRSLASIALRKALDVEVQYKYHFDYFSVDFNEEFSALYGGSLQNQTDFVSDCIAHILNLYQNQTIESGNEKPSSLVLVGHSVGGMIAMSALSKESVKSKVSTIITMATPHQPVIVMDSQTKSFYDSVNNLWNTSLSDEDPYSLRDISLIALGGGEKDIQVRSGIAKSQFADVNVALTSISDVWLSTDHRCMVWCKQVILSINRALFDTVDTITGQITSDVQLRKSVFNYHLVDKYSFSNSFKSKESFFRMNFDKDGYWHDGTQRQFNFEQDSVQENSHLMIKILDDPKHSRVTIKGKNIIHDDWVFGCKATTIYKMKRICSSGDNLSSGSKLLPSVNGTKEKTITLDMHSLHSEHGYTHIVIQLPKNSERIKIDVDVYDASERSMDFSDLPRWIFFWKKTVIIEETVPTAIHYNISFSGLEYPWQAYDLTITPKGKCEEAGLIQTVVPWSLEDTYSWLDPIHSSRQILKLQDTNIPESKSLHPYVITSLSPSCQFKIEINASMQKIWGQMIRFYFPLIFPFTVSVLILTLAQQTKLYDSKRFPGFVLVIRTSVTPILAALPSKLLSSLISSRFLSFLLPKTDFTLLAEQSIDFGVLSMLLYFLSIGLVTVVAFSIRTCCVIMGKILVSDFISGFMSRERSEGSSITKTIFISSFLVVLTASTCGTLALISGTAIHFFHSVYYYAERLKSIKLRDGQAQKHSNIFQFQLNLTLLWAFTSVLNTPSLLAWYRNLPFEPKLTLDPSFLIAIVMSASISLLWHDLGSHSKNACNMLRLCIHVLSLVTLLYGTVSLYRLNYIIGLVFLLYSIFALTSTSTMKEE